MKSPPLPCCFIQNKWVAKRENDDSDTNWGATLWDILYGFYIRKAKNIMIPENSLILILININIKFVFKSKLRFRGLYLNQNWYTDSRMDRSVLFPWAFKLMWSSSMLRSNYFGKTPLSGTFHLERSSYFGTEKSRIQNKNIVLEYLDRYGDASNFYFSRHLTVSLNAKKQTFSSLSRCVSMLLGIT